jgi:hypothetical protein
MAGMPRSHVPQQRALPAIRTERQARLDTQTYVVGASRFKASVNKCAVACTTGITEW